MGSEQCSSIGDDVEGESIKAEDGVEEEIGELSGGNGFLGRVAMNHLCENDRRRQLNRSRLSEKSGV